MPAQLITAEIVTDDSTLAAAEIHAINRFHRAATTKADEARTLAQEAAHYALLCGTRLEALKASCGYGEWGKLFSPRQIGTKPGSGSDLVLEFSLRTADKYIEVAKRIRLEQKLSGKAQKRLAAISTEDELAEDDRDFLSRITEGRNLRQLYLDLDIITAPDKEPKSKPAPPAGPKKSTQQAKLEEAREYFHIWQEDWRKNIRIGALDDLDREGVLALKEFLSTCRDQVNARLK